MADDQASGLRSGRRQTPCLQEEKATADRIVSASPPDEAPSSIMQNSASKRMRCLTFQSKAPGRAGRPDQVVQALEVVRPLEFKPGEAVIGDHRPHGEGRLELGDVHVAVGRGQGSQAAWDRREKKGKSLSVMFGHPDDKHSTKRSSGSPRTRGLRGRNTPYS